MEPTKATDRQHQPDLLNTAEAAAYLRISASKLNKDRANGRGPRFVRMGTKIFYRKPDLEDCLTAATVETIESQRK